MDIVDKKTRSRMMSGIRSKNTKPELLVRRLLHKRGFRYRLHDSRLPGKPDLVFPKYGAVIFIHGCFWHGHQCRFFRLPGTRTDFWKNKISGNRKRDRKTRNMLSGLDWRIAIVWECALRGSGADPQDVIDRLAEWLTNHSTDATFLEIRG
jgi:DNA mismatch endonuclease Vsr